MCLTKLWVLPFALILAALAAVFVWRAEELQTSATTIHGFGQAAWWAIVTMVGNGESYPVSTQGRIAAVLSARRRMYCPRSASTEIRVWANGR